HQTFTSIKLHKCAKFFRSLPLRTLHPLPAEQPPPPPPLTSPKMGGRRGGRNGRTQRKHFKENRDNVWKRSKSDPQPGSTDDTAPNNGEDSRGPNWQPLPLLNPAFEEYYKRQGIVTDEEWDTFMDYLRKPLPSAFRINSSGQFCLDIRSQLEDDFVKTLQEEFTGEDEADAIRPLPWYPENLAWHSNFSRNQLRKNQTLARFHEFLKLANEIGNITRQEAVSMVPPLFLDVHPEHFVLDMCAAPGSKTFQLLEIIHKSSEPGELPSGMVVANDVDVQRSNLLIHQTKRMCTANLMVTNHEAQNFPGCNLKKHNYKATDAKSTDSPVLNQLLFDRVLCDVPCSGDGTLRKAPDMWRKWNVGMGNGLHNLQLQIAMRGLSLLKVGGRMVYSTCSMNPVENEAVVAEILRRCKDSVELVDVSTELPELVRRPGMKKWKVRDKGAWLRTYKDVKMYRRPGIVPSIFPSGRSEAEISDNKQAINPSSEEMETGTDANSETVSCVNIVDEETSTLPLERCMRIVPHDQNTGAFFIAVFQKHSPLPITNDEGKQESDIAVCTEKSETLEVEEPEKSSSEPVPCQSPDINGSNDQQAQKSEPNGSEDQQEVENPGAGSEKAGTKRKLQMQGKWKGIDPVILFNDEKIINHIKTFYGIVDSFPLFGHLVSRNSDANHIKRIYYISKPVRDVLELNVLVGGQLKIASVGLKMFERQTSKEGTSSPCSFRISSEGLPVLLPFITKQILHASAIDFKHLLQYKSIKFRDFVDAEFGEKAAQTAMGCCVIVLREDGQCSSDPVKVTSSTLAIGCWKGKANMTVMVTAIDCQDLLERLVKRLEAKGIFLEEKEEKGVLSEEGTENVQAADDSESKEADEAIPDEMDAS
ncbi:hypothetical protein V2J09_021726, partial [Rumex salicifolius]